MKNSRTIKNIIMIFIIVLCAGATYFTMTQIKAVDNNSNSNNQQMGTPPNMNNGSSQGGNMGTPPDMNNGNMQGGPGNMPSNNDSSSISVNYYIIFGVESFLISALLVYLLMSHFNKKSFKEVIEDGDKFLIYILLVIILTAGLTFADGMISKKYFLENNSTANKVETQNTSNTEASGAKEIDSVESLSNETYTSKKNDENAILVKDGGDATLTDVTIEKSGDSSNTESSDFTGVNAGVLVQSNAKATIKNAKITTNAKGGNAVFSTGENSKIYISDSTISTTGESSSRGLDATYGGYIEADNMSITTKGASSATLATDRGEGTVKVSNSTLETNGAGSPVIYSTGDISINKTKGTANNSQMVVVEGKNSATVKNSSLIASGKGNRNDVDNAGIMIYQSMSGDAGEGTGTFISKNSTLQIDENSDLYKTAPMFFITNTTAVINLEDTKLSYGSNILLSAKGTNEWGNSGSNGGDVTLNATNQTLKGDIIFDKLSTLTMNLENSNYSGTINQDKNAKEITIKLSKDSKITLTGDSYITSLENEDASNSNIDFNGYKLYINGKAIN